MKPDLIFANSPYGKPGVDITKYIMENFPDANYAMLNTRSAFKKYYDKLACQYVQIGQYELGTNKKLDWGVAQAILLATNGWTEVVDNRKKVGENKVGMNSIFTSKTSYYECHMAHLVGVDQMSPSSRGFQAGRISHLVGAPVAITMAAWNQRARNATLVQLSRADTVGTAATHCRSTTLVQANNNPTETKLRNGYIYISFETFEEACECAIDIISWKNPTDSHYRCVKWGFVCGLVPHCKNGF